MEEALPGTSLSAVQYSTVRDTTDRVGLVLRTRTGRRRRCFGGGGDGAEGIGCARLFPSATALPSPPPPRYEYQFSVYLRTSLSQRVISSQSVWAQLIISRTDV